MTILRHTSSDYEADLEELRRRLLKMAGRVDTMISQSVQSLVNRDSDLASETIRMDAQVNTDEVELDRMCMALLACRQPMASDLRFITITLKMVTDLERIADLAVNICERSIQLKPRSVPAPYIDIPQMDTIVRSMLEEAIKAFIERDIQAATLLLDRDDEVDELYHKVFRHILELMNGGLDLTDGIALQSVAKVLERMGDHVTNLAEHVIFMVGGEDVRHEGKLMES